MSMYNGKARLKQPGPYKDGRTKQSFRDECDINKIMNRAAQGGTISHLTKFQPVYADFSDYDFVEQTRRLAEGQTVFDDLPAEIRREFHQSPDEFFAYVNDPANIEDLHTRLPALARPGTQLIKTSPPNADEEKAATAAASELASATPTPTVEPTTESKPEPSGETS